jgi:hypothetical protein
MGAGNNALDDGALFALTSCMWRMGRPTGKNTFSLLALLLVFTLAWAPEAGAGRPQPGAASARPKSVVLGLNRNEVRNQIGTLAVALKGSAYYHWHEHGLTDGYPTSKYFFAVFHRAMRKVVWGGGRIRFDLTGLNIRRLLAVKDAERVKPGKITGWELLQLRKDPYLFSAIDFYRHDGTGYKMVSPEEVERMGIRPLPRPR